MELINARVLHISKYYYPFIGGTEQVARDIVKALKGYVSDQKVICFNEDAQDGEWMNHKRETVIEIVDGVEVVRCGYIINISSQAISLTYKRELDRIIKEFKPNVIILHYPNPFVTHYLLKYKDYDFKLAVYWHLDIYKQRIIKHLFYNQNVTLIRRADMIMGATPKHIYESAFTNQFGEKGYVLPLMIDENKLKLSDKEICEAIKIRKIWKGQIIGFFIGRHVEYKGLEYLIKASGELGNENIHFFIAGSGELTEKMKAMAKEDSKIEFIGRITDSQKRIYLYASDIFCFPSITRNEGFGLALAEGMYFGKPAVVFNIPGSGVNYLNQDGVTGIECPNRDYKAYANALRRLCLDSDLRVKYGNAGRDRILKYFTNEHFQVNTVKAMENLLK